VLVKRIRAFLTIFRPSIHYVSFSSATLDI
jgi:hypothetical protein